MSSSENAFVYCNWDNVFNINDVGHRQQDA